MFVYTYKYWFDISYFSFPVCSSSLVQCEDFAPLIGSASDSIFACVSSVETRYCDASLLSVEFIFFCNSFGPFEVLQRSFITFFFFTVHRTEISMEDLIMR